MANKSMREKSAAILREAAEAKQAKDVSPFPALVSAPKSDPKTAPGGMLAFRADRQAFERQIQALEAGNEELQAKLREFDGHELVIQLDPGLIDPSTWANRDEINFSEDNIAFKELKEEIKNAGGNVQSIKVRRKGDRFEVVFGHRRLRACRELGLPVSAIVEDLDDQQLFVQMDRENRARKNLSPYEQGVMYRKALAEGLFKTQVGLQEAIGVTQGAISKAMTLAALPVELVNAFPSKLDLQFRHAQVLSKLLEKDSKAVISKAKELAKMSPKLDAGRVLQVLSDAVASHEESEQAAEVSAFVAKVDSKGLLTLKLHKALSEDQHKKLVTYVEKLIG